MPNISLLRFVNPRRGCLRVTKCWAVGFSCLISLDRVQCMLARLKCSACQLSSATLRVFAHRLRTLDRSLVPPSESPSNISPTPQKSYPKFRNPRTTFENTPLRPPKYSIVRGVGGVPDFFEGLESSYFCYLGAHAKFQNPMTTSSGRISNEPEERKKERERRKKIHSSRWGSSITVCACLTVPSSPH